MKLLPRDLHTTAGQFFKEYDDWSEPAKPHCPDDSYIPHFLCPKCASPIDPNFNKNVCGDCSQPLEWE